MVDLFTSQEMIYSVITGFSTVLGTLLVFLFRFNQKSMAFFLGCSAGVLVLVSLVTLFPSAYRLGYSWHHVFGVSLGLLLMVLLHHYSSSKVEDEEKAKWLRLGFFLVVAIAAHNIPEGIAIGISFHYEHHLGLALVIALIIHNIPEGMGLATPFLAAKRSYASVLGWSLFCAITLPLGTWLGLTYLVQVPGSLPIGFTFAGTIMLWIVCTEIGPRAWSQSRGHSVIGFLSGAMIMYIVHLFHG